MNLFYTLVGCGLWAVGCGLWAVGYATLRYATLRYATLRYATLRYATLRYATLRVFNYASYNLFFIKSYDYPFDSTNIKEGKIWRYGRFHGLRKTRETGHFIFSMANYWY